MKKGIKQIRGTISSIKFLHDRHQYLEKDFVALEGQEAYELVTKYYDNMLATLQKELLSLPIGHRYIGTFYLKKQYTTPVEAVKVSGSIFMREDLVSWYIEDDRSSYYRAIYKDPELKVEITREEATPVYAAQ